MSGFEPVLLRKLGVENAAEIDSYVRDGGYQTARRVLTAMKPEEVIEHVKASGLRGRGGAGFPTGVKWGFVPRATDRPKYLVCNADESEPGTFKDRVLIETDPHALLEGMIIAAYAIGAHVAYVYIRGEFGAPFRILDRAVRQAREKGFLGKNLFGSGYDLEIHLHRGAGAYICGEETALLNSLEGKRGYPRIKPPFPAVEGLFGCPTIVNNVETLMTLVPILQHEPEWFRRWGTEKSPGFKVYCVSGHVRRPGVYELPMGIPIRELIFDHAGGIRDGRRLKGVVPGGSSSGVLTEAELDTRMDFESLAAKGMILGTGACIVMDETVCMVRALWNTLRFFHHESCGQCTPCREGTGWLDKMVACIERGEGSPHMIDTILDVAARMCGRTICVLADAAAMPTKHFIQRYRGEFEEHVRARGCPFRKEAAPAPA